MYPQPHCMFIGILKYIGKLKQTGDQGSAASNCFIVGGCMIRVVCFNLGSRTERMKGMNINIQVLAIG